MAGRKRETKPPLKAFISYKRESDAVIAWVKRFGRDLRQNGIEALFDEWEVSLGGRLDAYMKSIPAVDVFLFVITPGSIAAIESPGGGGAVRFEVELARAQVEAGAKLRFVPVMLAGEGSPGLLLPTLCADFRDAAAYASRFAALIDDLKGKQRRPPLLGAGRLLYDARLYRMLPAVAGSPVRQISAKFEPLPGFPFFSFESDHPSRWPKRVDEDRMRFGARILAFLADAEHAAAVAAALKTDPSTFEILTSRRRSSEEQRTSEAMQVYSKLRMLFNLNLEGDAARLKEALGEASTRAFLDLENDWQVLGEQMPNRILTLGLSHDRAVALEDVTVSLAIVGDLYDAMLDEDRALAREELEAIGVGHKFTLDLGSIPPASTTFLRIWFNYIALADRFDPKPIHVRAEPTEGVLLHSLGAEGVDVEPVSDLVRDERVYEPCAIELRFPAG